MQTIFKQFGERVRDLRRERGFSQEKLAEKAELHYTYIGGIERCERNLSLKNIKRIADALEIDIRELFNIHYKERLDTAGTGLISDINILLSDKDVNILQLIKILIKDIDEWYKAKRKK